MSTYDRALIEAAIRNGVDISAGEAAELLAERDQLAALLDAAVEQRRRTEAALDQAHARVRAAEAVLDDHRHGDLDPAGGLDRVRAALRGER